ncbi:unnamed protein product, partial [Closterium sp. NIES-54]
WCGADAGVSTHWRRLRGSYLLVHGHIRWAHQVGYGDIHPMDTLAERLFATVYILLTAIMLGYTIGELSSMVYARRMQRESMRQRMLTLHRCAHAIVTRCCSPSGYCNLFSALALHPPALTPPRPPPVMCVPCICALHPCPSSSWGLLLGPPPPGASSSWGLLLGPPPPPGASSSWGLLLGPPPPGASSSWGLLLLGPPPPGASSWGLLLLLRPMHAGSSRGSASQSGSPTAWCARLPSTPLPPHASAIPMPLPSPCLCHPHASAIPMPLPSPCLRRLIAFSKLLHLPPHASSLPMPLLSN